MILLLISFLACFFYTSFFYLTPSVCIASLIDIFNRVARGVLEYTEKERARERRPPFCISLTAWRWRRREIWIDCLFYHATSPANVYTHCTFSAVCCPLFGWVVVVVALLAASRWPASKSKRWTIYRMTYWRRSQTNDIPLLYMCTS